MTLDEFISALSALFDTIRLRSETMLRTGQIIAQDLNLDVPPAFKPAFRRYFKKRTIDLMYDDVKTCVEKYRDMCDLAVTFARESKPDLKVLARTIGEHSARFWFTRNEVREKASAWVHGQPKGSLERAFMWSTIKLLTLQYGVRQTIDELILEADTLPGDVTNIALNTPTSYIEKAILESHNLDEATERIEKIKTMLLHHFKEVTRCHQKLGVELNV